MYISVLLYIALCYCVVLCITMYCSVFMCIGLYSFVLLFIASGKLAVYDSVAAEVLQIIWELVSGAIKGT